MTAPFIEKPMTKTRALAIARRAHSPVRGGFSSGYQFQYPAQLGQPYGRSATFSCSDYNAARRARAESVVQCALRVLGYTNQDAGLAVDWARQGSATGLTAILDAALARLEQEKQA